MLESKHPLKICALTRVFRFTSGKNASTFCRDLTTDWKSVEVDREKLSSVSH